MIRVDKVNSTQTENSILQVPIEDIIPNRFQPRLAFDDDSLKDLSASIKQHGIIQPLVLRRINDKYEIIAGERRYKAAKMAGLISVPAIISNLDDNTSAEVAIVENVQRKDLTAIEEAKSYQALLDKGYMTQEDLAKKMGLSQSAISNKLRLLSLDESVQDAILQSRISERHARSLLKITDKEKQKELLERTINERLTVKQLETEIKNILSNEKELENISSDQNVESLINKMEENVEMNQPVNNPFSVTPEKMPNKFFNFLEDTAANMNVEEEMPSLESLETPTENNSVFDLLNQTDEIEMLDDFSIPEEVKEDSSNDYLKEVINKVRELNLDSEKVAIEEIDTPIEYRINITIKKDN